VITLPPGSLPWLLAHELRLTWREATGKRGAVRTVIVLCVFGALAISICAPIALALAGQTLTITPLLAAEVDGALLILFNLMLSQTLIGATTALYTRGDMDLLLSSPLSGRKVLAVRAIALALSPFLLYAALVTPFLLPAAATGHPQWLAAYGVLAALALFATTVGVGLAMALFAAIGPRATRTVAQVLAAIAGASLYLAFQARNLSSDNGAGAVRWLMAFATGDRFGPASPLGWPSRALVGEPLPLLIVATASGLAFAALITGLGRRFVANAGLSAASDVGPRVGRSKTLAAPGRFAGSPFTAIVRKEWRLLRRDPTLLTQVLVRLLAMSGVAFALFRHSDLAAAVAAARAAGVLTFIAGQLAGSLVWIAISAEDAPELIACSPIAGGLVRRAKVAAALAPVAILIAPLIVGLAWLSPWASGVAIVSTMLAAISTSLLNLWFEKPTPRSAFRRRGGSVVVSLGELGLSVCWALAAALAILAPIWALAPVAVGLGMLALFRWLGDPERLY